MTADEAEVTELSDAYEAALLANDRAILDAAFWSDDRVLRFGIAEQQRGWAEVAAWRAASPGVSPRRRITSREVCELAEGVVAVDITFVDPDSGDGPGPVIGRQSQTWVRTPAGWRIVRAHVSLQR